MWALHFPVGGVARYACFSVRMRSSEYNLTMSLGSGGLSPLLVLYAMASFDWWQSGTFDER